MENFKKILRRYLDEKNGKGNEIFLKRKKLNRLSNGYLDITIQKLIVDDYNLMHNELVDVIIVRRNEMIKPREYRAGFVPYLKKLKLEGKLSKEHNEGNNSDKQKTEK